MKIAPIIIASLVATTILVAVHPVLEAKISGRYCREGAAAAETQCFQGFESRHFDFGSINYLREDRLKDIPFCRHIREASLSACNGDDDDLHSNHRN